MGFFEGLNNKARIDNEYKNDKPGRYLMRIDLMTCPTTQAGEEYFKIAKTTVKVLGDHDGLETNKEGEETTQAIFRGKHNYSAKDVLRIAAVVLGMTPTEVSNVGFEEIKKRLVTNNEAMGEVIEIEVTPNGVSAEGKVYLKHTWIKNHTLAERRASAPVPTKSKKGQKVTA